MSIIYKKRGAHNYKEKKLIAAIEKAIQEKTAKDSSFSPTFKAATNYDELKDLHSEICIENASFEEVKEEKKEVNSDSDNSSHEDFRKGLEDSVEPPKAETSSQPFVDPFNESEPTIRAYVNDDGFKDDENEKETKTTFEEPDNYKDSFEMPNSEDESGTSGKSAKEPIKKSEKQEKKPSAPINPSFDSMDNSKKKRSTKKFAKIIVEGTCMLAEKGCIWWTTKDITEDKLATYELEDTMDLHLLLTLENNQKQPVIEWFRARVKEANELFKIGDEEKQDLIDSLYEVMLEKGIAPTPMQELIINAVKTFVLDMGLKAYGLSSQINNVLAQLKTMKIEDRKVENIEHDEFTENPAMAEDTSEQTEQKETSTSLAKID